MSGIPSLNCQCLYRLELVRMTETRDSSTHNITSQLMETMYIHVQLTLCMGGSLAYITRAMVGRLTVSILCVTCVSRVCTANIWIT